MSPNATPGTTGTVAAPVSPGLQDRDRHSDRVGDRMRHRITRAQRLHGAGQRGEPASRLADRAESGQILVTERTLAEAKDVAVANPIDEIHLQGISRPIKIYELEPRLE
jgi:class 3 adenylate cyclase